jgi:hypothetical protein
VCKRNPLLTFDPDWSPEDLYQPKSATGRIVCGEPFASDPELIITVDPAYRTDCSATVKAEKHQTDRPDPLKDSLGYWDWVFNTGRFLNIKIPSVESIRKQAEEFNELFNKKNTETMKTEKPSYEELALALKETDQFWKDMLNGKKHASEEITRAMANECILKKLVPVEEELTLEDCVKRNRIGCCNSSPYDAAMAYPTDAIAEKVLLYGLLQSVAHKLNGRKTGLYLIDLRNGILVIREQQALEEKIIDPMFATRGLAEQAILIFAKSKFDLKKLYQ